MEYKQHPVVFTGTGKEYFGIWIVNLVLTILTLGIYSAWAKVRTRRYFNQNTSIADRRFDYHATGKQILIGRIIVVVGYVIFNILTNVLLLQPVLLVIVFLAFLAAIPWLLNRAFRFNARMTSWSGLRFNFEGSYWGAFRTFLLYPILALFTLYLALPWVARAQHRYRISAHRFGTAKFNFDSEIGPFVKAFGLALLWIVGIGVIGVVAFGLPAMLTDAFDPYSGTSELGIVIAIFAIYGIALLAILPAAFIYQAYVRNAVYAGVDLEGGHKFLSDVKPTGLLWVALSNAVLVVISLGLAIPFTAIRMSRYLAAHTYALEGGSLDDFIGEQQEQLSALGDAFADFEGFDVGAGV